VLVTLPVWMQSCKAKQKDQQLSPSSFSASEQSALSAIADTIIPAGNAIGALSVGVNEYLQKIFDDCYEKPEQDNLKKQLKALDAASASAYGRSFTNCDQQQRQTLLLTFAHSTKKEEKDFFDLVKSETIRGFNTSQKVMEEYFHYKVAPGPYYGCVSIKT